MLYKDALIVDYGSSFQGEALMSDEGIVCVIPRHLYARNDDGKIMRELVEGVGGNCGECRGCPWSRVN
jgi:hypothetical protein